MRIAINGMGRIGRLLFRRLTAVTGIELVAVNDIMPADNLIYLIRYDSIYGPFTKSILLQDGKMVIDGKSVIIFQKDHPSELPWKGLNIDVVLECTGQFTGKDVASEHLKAGACNVLLSTTGQRDIQMLIYGYNHELLGKDLNILSPGGCMTNCTVPILSVLSSIGIESAQINVLHSYTSRQELVDSPHNNFRRGRAAAESIIPVAIDLAKSLEMIMPDLKDKISTTSIRVPIPNGALADFSVILKQDLNKSEINYLFQKSAKKQYTGILDYTEDPLVSLDIKGNPHSCIVDGTLTSILGNHLKLFAWFDNEYGYTSRMIDWLLFWKKRGV